MVWCEGGRQAGHTPTVNRERGIVDSNVSTKSDMTIGFEIQVRNSHEFESCGLWKTAPQEPTACTGGWFRSPTTKKLVDSPHRKMPTVGLFATEYGGFFFF
jgi:hypothetical protein